MNNDADMGPEKETALRELFERARALSDLPDTDLQIVELLSAYVRFKPDHGIAWFHFGDALRVIGRLADAEQALRRALDLAPENRRFTVYARIAMVIEKRGSPADAEKWYRLATSEAGCPGWMWCLRGSNLLSSETHALARTCFEAALKSDDADREEVFLNLALLARMQRRYDEARGYLQEALKIDPNYGAAKKALESLAGIEKTIEAAETTSRQIAGDATGETA
jgi:tetratricopeptide (TPR) repeat protein